MKKNFLKKIRIPVFKIVASWGILSTMICAGADAPSARHPDLQFWIGLVSLAACVYTARLLHNRGLLTPPTDKPKSKTPHTHGNSR